MIWSIATPPSFAHLLGKKEKPFPFATSFANHNVKRAASAAPLAAPTLAREAAFALFFAETMNRHLRVLVSCIEGVIYEARRIPPEAKEKFHNLVPT